MAINFINRKNIWVYIYSECMDGKAYAFVAF